MGGEPPRARVRRVDQAETLEVRHDVAHRGRRQRHRQRATEIARADRLAGRKISLDDALEDLARALVELAQARGGFGRGFDFIDVGVAHGGLKSKSPLKARQTARSQKSESRDQKAKDPLPTSAFRFQLSGPNSGTMGGANSSGAPKWAK